MEFIKNYFDEIKKTIDKVSLKEVEEVIHVLHQAYKEDKQIFIMGNGGSASLASHFACDIGKGTLEKNYETKKRFRVMSLTDNIATITAYANDLNYEEVFSQQLKNLVLPKDIVIAITGSGNSKNIIRGIEETLEMEGVTIGFTGFNGGRLKKIIDYNIHVPSRNYGIIEDTHTILTHIISSNLAKLNR